MSMSRGGSATEGDGARTVLGNGSLRVEVSAPGAELVSLRRVGSQVEYLWQGDPAHWGRRAPWLFPIVGALRGGVYTYQGCEYRLPQHGFARDRRFALVASEAARAVYELRDDEASRACFPFHFCLRVTYRLIGDVLAVDLGVDNPGPGELLFSVGGHPGFNWPLTVEEGREGFLVELAHAENAERWPVVEGLIADRPEPFLCGERVVELAPGLFERGALVFKSIRSRCARYMRRDRSHGVELVFDDFPYFALWSKPGAPFVCLEPWSGIADSVSASGRLEDKEGILRLEPGESLQRRLAIKPW